MRRLALILFLAAAGCVALPHATPEDVSRAQQRWPEVNASVLAAGRASYVARCSGCHALHLPSEKSPDEWPRALDEMAQDAKLTPQDRELIERYLVTMSGRAVQKTARK